MAFEAQSVQPPTTPTPFSTASIRRWGSRALRAFLLGGLVVTFVLAWIAPDLVVLLPALPLAAVAGLWLFQQPLASLLALLGGYALIISPVPGIQPGEALYGVFLLAFLAHWYGTRLLSPKANVIQTTEDRLAFMVLLLVVFGGALLGMVMGAPLGKTVGETTALGMFALYFPIKEACLRDDRAPGLIVIVVLFLGVFVAVRNLLHLEEILMAATQAWHIADARFATNETQLVVAALAALLLAVGKRSFLVRGIALGLFLFLFGGLVLTKSRAYWLAFLFALACVVFLLKRNDRRRFLTLAAAGAAATAVPVFLFFGNAVMLLLDGVVRRFASLESAASQDISLINRFIETAAVWERILENPLLGYGLGFEYGYHSIIYRGLLETAFIHNGYIWLWYKVGLWGLALVLFFYGRAIWCGVQVARRAPERYQTYGLWASVTLLGLAPAFLTSNGFPLPDVMLMHVILIALACGLKARYVPSPARTPSSR